MRIVFMGTPDFAAASLQKLIDEKLDLVGVFTQPDKPKNRGMKLTASPVKELALEAGIPVFQPAKMRDGTALQMLRDLKPDLAVVVAYGRLIPDELLAVPTKGSINIHGSILPKYRGSAPIQWAVLNGEKTTGVSAMYLSSDLDCGDVICTEETEIGEYETAGELFDRLKVLGAELLIKTIRSIDTGCVCCSCQNHSEATFAPPLTKEMSPIDWNRSPREIVKHICGLNPWPVATTELQGHSFKVYEARYTENKTKQPAGTVVSADCKTGIEVVCGTGETLLLTRVQAPGGKQMCAADYLRGHPMNL